MSAFLSVIRTVVTITTVETQITNATVRGVTQRTLIGHGNIAMCLFAREVTPDAKPNTNLTLVLDIHAVNLGHATIWAEQSTSANAKRDSEKVGHLISRLKNVVSIHRHHQIYIYPSL